MPRSSIRVSRKTCPFRLTDWTREPVLDSEHDARKRIYLVTPGLFGTKAVKGEMIIYPPGTAAANHHHEGAEHFMYVLRGRGTVYANEKPFPVKAGDVIYYPDRERHYLEAAKDEELVFAEFFAPAEFKTIWVNENEVCTWQPTGRDIRGRMPAREIKAHSVRRRSRTRRMCERQPPPYGRLKLTVFEQRLRPINACTADTWRQALCLRDRAPLK